MNVCERLRRVLRSYKNGSFHFGVQLGPQQQEGYVEGEGGLGEAALRTDAAKTTKGIHKLRAIGGLWMWAER